MYIFILNILTYLLHKIPRPTYYHIVNILIVLTQNSYLFLSIKNPPKQLKIF